MSQQYLIRREDGKFVSQPGSQHSYTSRLECARIYADRDQAMADKCGNETLIRLDSIIPELQ